MAKGGSINPVVVVTDADLRQNGGRYVLLGGPAIPVDGQILSNATSRKDIAGGSLVPVYIVDSTSSVQRETGGGKPTKVVELSGRKIRSRYAQPVFVSAGVLGKPLLAVYVETGQYTADATASVDYQEFALTRIDTTWVDGTTGHIDAVYVDGVLQYYTASQFNPSFTNIVVKHPDETYETVTPDYYVDSADGNDGNDGLTPGQALATIGALPAFSAGDVIALESQSVWLEKIVADEQISIYRYGPGTKPILDARDAAPTSGWTNSVGNEWTRTITFEDNEAGIPIESPGDDQFLPLTD